MCAWEYQKVNDKAPPFIQHHITENLLELLSPWSLSVPEEEEGSFSFSPCFFEKNKKTRAYRALNDDPQFHFPEGFSYLSILVLLYIQQLHT